MGGEEGSAELHWALTEGAQASFLAEEVETSLMPYGALQPSRVFLL